MLNEIILQLPVFLLIFARVFVMLMTLPLFSMRGVSRLAKIALAAYVTFFIMSTVNYNHYDQLLIPNGVASLHFLLLVVGEGLIGVILGLYITIIFSAFSTAGQFMAFQMGFSAASTYDSLAQVENPLLGQFFNFAALLVFLQTKWFQKLFLGGLLSSFKTLTVFTLVENINTIAHFLLKSLSRLFADALVISLPVMGTLVLITICMGLLSKAAPQMNLLSEGFPTMILISFFLIMLLIPPLIDFFERSFSIGFRTLESLFIQLSGGGL